MKQKVQVQPSPVRTRERYYYTNRAMKDANTSPFRPPVADNFMVRPSSNGNVAVTELIDKKGKKRRENYLEVNIGIMKNRARINKMAPDVERL